MAKQLFKDKHCLVTGAGSGMGRELVIQLEALGATVIATDLLLERVEETASLANSGQGKVLVQQLDVTDQEQFQSIVDARFQVAGLDYLFNNAGIASFGEFQDVPRDEWRKMIDINLWGVINGCSAVYPHFLEKRQGHIINIASAAGLAPIPFMVPYAATKHAVVGLSTSLREEAKAYDVQVSVVCPGVVSTGIFEAATGFHFDISDIRKLAPIQEITVQQAVKEIIKGVHLNQAKIVFPLSAKLLAMGYQVTPELPKSLGNWVFNRIRKQKKSN